MHIGLYSPHWPPSGGANGIASYVAEVREHFLARGHDVSVIADGMLHDSSGGSRALGSAGSTACGPGRGFLRRVVRAISWRLDTSSGALAPIGKALARQVAEAHRLSPFDIFEMEESFGWSKFVAEAIDVPVITRLHGPMAVKPIRSLTEAELDADAARCIAEAEAVRSAFVVTSPTHAILEETCAKSRRPIDETTKVIFNPIRIPDKAPAWQPDACDPGHILMVSRFDFWKGADTMALAFERLLDTRPDLRLTMVGPDVGIEDENGIRLDFEAWSKANLSANTRARISFEGLLEPDAIAQLRRSAAICVCASRWESFSYVLLEAMVAGSPLLCTNWPASSEIILDGKTGLLTPVADPEAMAANLERLLADPGMAAEMGAASRRRVEQFYTTDVVGDEMLDCYRSAILAWNQGRRSMSVEAAA